MLRNRFAPWTVAAFCSLFPIAATAQQNVAGAGMVLNGDPILFVQLEENGRRKGKFVDVPKYIASFKYRKTHYTFRWNTKRLSEANIAQFASEVCAAQSKQISQPDWNRGGPVRNQKAAFTCK